MGLFGAWNYGISLSNAKYVMNLNADDELLPNGLEVLVKKLEGDPQVGIVYGKSRCIDEFTNSVYDIPKTPPQCDTLFSCLAGPHPLWRRCLHYQVGNFDEKYLIASDFDMWIRMAKVSSIFYLRELVGIYYRRKKSLSQENPEEKRQEALTILKSHFLSAPPRKHILY